MHKKYLGIFYMNKAENFKALDTDKYCSNKYIAEYIQALNT